MHWQTSRYRIDLSRPKVMGVVNVTPDSFFDGGLHASVSAAIAHCQRLVAEGADMLDIGGESTRPGADSLGAGARADPGPAGSAGGPAPGRAGLGGHQ
jgi:dihydropteroate synthase